MRDNTLQFKSNIKGIVGRYLELVNLLADMLFRMSIGLISLATILIFYQVMSRAILGTAPIWINELATYLAIWTVFILMGVLVWWNSHLAIEMVFEKLSDHTQKYLRYAQLLVITFLSTEFILHGYEFATVGGFRSQSLALGIDMFWIYVSTFVGGILLFIFATAKILEVAVQGEYAETYYKLPEGGLT